MNLIKRKQIVSGNFVLLENTINTLWLRGLLISQHKTTANWNNSNSVHLFLYRTKEFRRKFPRKEGRYSWWKYRWTFILHRQKTLRQVSNTKYHLRCWKVKVADLLITEWVIVTSTASEKLTVPFGPNFLRKDRQSDLKLADR